MRLYEAQKDLITQLEKKIKEPLILAEKSLLRQFLVLYNKRSKRNSGNFNQDDIYNAKMLYLADYLGLKELDSLGNSILPEHWERIRKLRDERMIN